MENSDNKYVHPKLMNAINSQSHKGIIKIDHLEINDIITLETKNSVYNLELVEKTDKSHKINFISTNPNIQSQENCKLIGTTVFPGASTICPGAFAVGGLTELWVGAPDKGKIITSEVISVSINGIKILPTLEVTA